MEVRVKTLEEIREEKRRKVGSLGADSSALIGAPLQSGGEQRQEGVLHVQGLSLVAAI